MTGTRSIRRGGRRLIVVAISAFLLSTMLVAVVPASAALAADPPGCVRGWPTISADYNTMVYTTLPLRPTKSIYLTFKNLDSAECGPTTYVISMYRSNGSAYVLAKFAATSVTVAPGASKRLKVHLSTTAKARVGNAAFFSAAIRNRTTLVESGSVNIFRVKVVP